MTTWIVNLKEGVIRQKNEMEEPDIYHSENALVYSQKMIHYRNHIASLKQYPILPGKWIEGKEYQDGEIELVDRQRPNERKRIEWVIMARLKEPEGQEEDLWALLRKDMAYESEEGETIYIELTNYWKSKYTLTRK